MYDLEYLDMEWMRSGRGFEEHFGRCQHKRMHKVGVRHE
jgi:hypothetical protein